MRLVWLAAALVVAGCSSSGSADDRFLPDSTSPQSAAELEANAGVRLPSGTVLLSAARTSLSGGLESRVMAQLRMPASAVPRFLANSGFEAAVPDQRTITDKDFPDSGTWHPDKATKVAGVIDGNRKVMVDLGHPEDVTVYVVTFQS
ncbi:hypothetical protein [Saccharothrix sp.]|uniref:hypothetical protein n=1 Tax=Saccharothrix sp. TaxID=1873460 RepID=UPI002810F684|nr:hypothetical protein [Saccharothrix sp.]